MSACERFESEGLELMERGEILDPHFESCRDCATARGEYELLRAALRAVPGPSRAPARWQERVWERVDRRSRLRRIWVATPAVAAVAAAVAFAVWPEGAGEPGITVERLARAGAPSRGAAAQPGDVVRVRAEPASSAHAELRVYRAGALVLRCGEGPACRREGDEIVADLRVDALGRYETLLLLSDGPIAPPAAAAGAPAAQAMNRDLEAALGAGARAVEGPAIDVY